ncbi:MAG: DNA topoisomerase 3 [Saprospiraceae bacterium]|nr:DNA topoisomerase 3 [Saprospiraceae bacterium]
MKVCIAEKPSVAREIAQIIGARTRQDGYYEGNGYCVSWTFGHLCTLKAPDDYQASWKKWSMHTLPILPDQFDIKLITNKGVKKQFGILKQLFKRAEVVINCGDAGQEGELIQRWVLQMAKYKGKVLRLWISSLTPEAIREGFQQLTDASQFDNLFHAGRSRAIGDWILGMNATRLYTLKYGGYKQLLSIGRVQTPTLAMIVERHHEIANFVPKPFWELQTLYQEVVIHSEKGRFYQKEEGEVLLQQVTGEAFKIVSFNKKKGKEYPPKLFDLTSLQVNANKRFGFSADQTLKLVQSLYEQKLVTYPRVDTTYLPNDIYPKVPGILSKMTNYSQFTQTLLGKPIRKSKKVFNDKKVTDHHAIIPTGLQKSLPAHEQKIYDAIARRFIAAFYPDCIVSHTVVIGESAGVSFKAKGKEILEEGWRVLYPKPASSKKPKGSASDAAKDSEEKEEEVKILPSFQVGETGPHDPALVEKKTQAPKNYTEATLLRAMETAGKKVDDEELRELMKANGIGRPSTRANIIETLFKRQYIRRQKKSILATETGIQLIGVIKNDLLKSASLTGQWEKQLREIEGGSFPAPQFIDNMRTMVAALVKEVQEDRERRQIVAPTSPKRGKIKKSKGESDQSSKRKEVAKVSKKKAKLSPTELTCPKCRKGKLLEGKAAYGCSEWKSGCGFRIPYSYKQKKIPQTQIVRLVAKGSTVQLKGFKEGEERLTGKLCFDNDHVIYLEQKKEQPTKSLKAQQVPDPIPCPKCGIGRVVKGKTAYGCSHWKTGCSFRFPFDEVRQKAGAKPLTKWLVWNILQGKS